MINVLNYTIMLYVKVKLNLRKRTVSLNTAISERKRNSKIMSYALSLKATIFLVFSLVGCAVSRNAICPFDYFFHLGDGVFDIGNAITIQPSGPTLPAAHFPYGITNPGHATGRWCDGLTDIDIGVVPMGFTEFAPYLSGNVTSQNAIIFAVARSPVLDRSFFESRSIEIPEHAVSLSTQMSWFKTHLSSICSTPTECSATLRNSIFFTGDVEANDIAYSLIQGKSIEEATSYVSNITQAQINVAREVIQMGSNRVIIVGNVPIGCYPYILTEFGTNDPRDYDDLGCLRNVNNLIVYKNNGLQSAIANLRTEFPNVTIFYGDFYTAFVNVLRESLAGSSKNVSMMACCGVGGNYNYDKTRFCGDQGATVCDNPSEYIFWDGIHLTQEGNRRLSSLLQAGALEALSCTTTQLNNSILQAANGTVNIQ